MEEDGADFEPPFALGREADYEEIVRRWEERLRAATGRSRSAPRAPSLDRDEDAVRIAWSAQAAVERIVPALVEHARAVTGLDAVCLAGGVALNCSTNGLLADPLYVPPVSADAGGALGAAWAVAPPRRAARTRSAPPGPRASRPPTRAPEGWTAAALDPAAVAERLAAGTGRRHRLGTRRGRPPCARPPVDHRPARLGRDARPRERREGPGAVAPARSDRHARRPTASSGAGPRGSSATCSAPRGDAARRERIAATVHVDGTAARRSRRHRAGQRRPGRARRPGRDPVLINTSFNTRGEPIVNTAEDAVRRAEAIGLDFLVVGDMLLDRR